MTDIFEELARKTVSELFDLLKEQVEENKGLKAEIGRLTNSGVYTQLGGLSIAQMREIVNDAPLGASFYTPNKGYSRMGSVLLDSALSLRDLRKEIADHDAKNMVKFSLNNYVRFKPTPYGLEHYTAKMSEFTSHMRGAVDIPTLNIDPEGYAKLQMHEFMNIFGEIAFNGNDNFIVGCEITFCLSGV